jgi:hypothetical protein
MIRAGLEKDFSQNCKFVVANNNGTFGSANIETNVIMTGV